ncbi:MAG: hypothetical protein QOC55_1631 [Thermoleophilaceae bacterium]|jgi:hypothetical protein|nr:hypothetical protein [Thermoleophilaceae bacterium]
METLRRTPRTTILAATAAILVISTAMGYWLLVGKSDDKQYTGWVIVSVVGTLIAAALLLRFVPATEAETDGNAPARRALVLGAAAFLTLVVFWTGLPIVLGIPALVLAAEGRARAGVSEHGGEATAGAVLGGFAAVAAVVALIAGA